MPRRPDFDKAVVPRRKLTHYLLDPRHPDGSPKALFLESFGFTADAPEQLEAALVQPVLSHEIAAQRSTAFGDIIEVVGALASPDGRDPVVRTVWIIVAEGDPPHFVTLVPDHAD